MEPPFSEPWQTSSHWLNSHVESQGWVTLSRSRWNWPCLGYRIFWGPWDLLGVALWVNCARMVSDPSRTWWADKSLKAQAAQVALMKLFHSSFSWHRKVIVNITGDATVLLILLCLTYYKYIAICPPQWTPCFVLKVAQHPHSSGLTASQYDSGPTYGWVYSWPRPVASRGSRRIVEDMRSNKNIPVGLREQHIAKCSYGLCQVATLAAHAQCTIDLNCLQSSTRQILKWNWITYHYLATHSTVLETLCVWVAPSPKHSKTEHVYNLLQLAKEECLTAMVLGVLLAEAFGFVWYYCPE